VYLLAIICPKACAHGCWSVSILAADEVIWGPVDQHVWVREGAWRCRWASAAGVGGATTAGKTTIAQLAIRMFP
jgi:hypothetical protein